MAAGGLTGAPHPASAYGQDVLDYARAKGWILPAEETIHAACHQITDWDNLEIRILERTEAGLPLAMEVLDVSGVALWSKRYDTPQELAFDIVVMRAYQERAQKEAGT